MNDVDERMFTRLKEGPAVLFLGQNYLKLEAGSDPFLSAVNQKYSESKLDQSYNDLLNSTAQDNPEAALAWMQGRCERFTAPKWLEQVATFAWSHIYTSAIDTIWPRTFRTSWRELQPILDEKYRYQNPRNRSRLHCTYLYGRVDRSDGNEQVPLSIRDWHRRNQRALALARRLPEIITPLGVLVIEGYDSSTDWFTLENLLSTIIDELNPGQTHLFSADPNLGQNPYAQMLVEDGKIIPHEESLASFVLQGVQNGLLTVGPVEDGFGFGRRVHISEGVVRSVPLNVWNQVSRSAVILGDTILAPPTALSDDARYREFRHFLSESGYIPIWQGYARGFAFERQFEKDLARVTRKKLSINKLHDNPILVSGQTGTGKTIALGHLAYKLRQEKSCPILFIGGKNKKPVLSDVDSFCQWVKGEWEAAEKPGAPTILIFWDANESDDYYGLLRYLTGRGHRVVLVGSCYRTGVSNKPKDEQIYVEAPAHLSSSEVKEWTAFLNGFEPTLGKQLQKLVSLQDNSFLVALYRLLPSTRSLIRRGIIKEFDTTEKILSQLTQSSIETAEIESPYFGKSLYYAMANAGLIEESNLLSSETERFAGDDVNDIQRLMGLVMMPGSFGLYVPFDLLLRALGKSGIRIYSELLSKFDIFHWYEDQTGDITIGPRQTLEARLWSRANLGGAQFEIDYAKQLLFEVRDTGDFYNNPEIEFAVNLVRYMGPNVGASESIRFLPFLRDVSETLGRLREERSIENPRLMLQEANLLREYVSQQSRSGAIPQDAEQMLDNAEAILLRAIELVGTEPKRKGVFLGELAALQGTRFRNYLYSATNPKEIMRLFQVSRDAALEAWSVDTENYYPVDILSWTARELLNLEDDALPIESRFEVETDILHAFEMAESEEFSADQELRFQSRRYEIGNVIGKTELTDDAFRKLEEKGSSAGYYLRAHNMVSEVPFDKPLDVDQLQQCRKAVDYLEQNKEVITSDGRTLYMLLRLWWMSNTGRPMFFGERQVLPFSQDDWLYCSKLIRTLMMTDDIYYNPRLLYLSGLSAFHLGGFPDAFDIFKDLEREADYRTGRRRIIRSYLASLPSGEPRIYSGQVQWVTENHTKGGLYLPEIRKPITFFPREFNRPDIQKGDSIGEFYVAFNFLGLIADPVTYYKAYKNR